MVADNFIFCLFIEQIAVALISIIDVYFYGELRC